MTRRLLVNDALSQLGERTFWHLLQEWFGCEFVGGDYATLADRASTISACATLDGNPVSSIIRNATWFPPIDTHRPTISLLQDIIPEGPMREMQEAVINSSNAVVFNSEFTAVQYGRRLPEGIRWEGRVIPLPVDFSLFTPQNAMGCQQALGLPDGAVCWVGASQGAAGQVKGWDIMLQIARLNPDIPFVCVFKDALPESCPPNMRCYMRLAQADLVKVIGACRVGLCTSRSESQHLAGIEMGACGLVMIAPSVGCYWQRNPLGGLFLAGSNADVPDYTKCVRTALSQHWDLESVRSYWQKEFDIPVVREAWEKLVEEIEGGHPSKVP